MYVNTQKRSWKATPETNSCRLPGGREFREAVEKCGWSVWFEFFTARKFSASS